MSYFESCLRGLNRCMNPPNKEWREETVVVNNSSLRSVHTIEQISESEGLKREPLVRSRAVNSTPSLLVTESNLPVKGKESNSPSGAIQCVRELHQPSLPVSRYFSDPTIVGSTAVIRGFISGIYE